AASLLVCSAIQERCNEDTPECVIHNTMTDPMIIEKCMEDPIKNAVFCSRKREIVERARKRSIQDECKEDTPECVRFNTMRDPMIIEKCMEDPIKNAVFCSKKREAIRKALKKKSVDEVCAYEDAKCWKRKMHNDK
ncbi:hypothetical protein PFISCL1PPCAC_26097, partial [Pristionchus fissidentatus]